MAESGQLGQECSMDSILYLKGRRLRLWKFSEFYEVTFDVDKSSWI